jgi:diaminopimelate decarboxylase/aspartate kinase
MHKDSISMRQFVVLKFGGTSVASRKNWATIGKIAEKSLQSDAAAVVVCSAVTGVSNLLESIAQKIATGQECESVMIACRNIHESLCRDMNLDFTEVLGPLFADLERLIHHAVAAGDFSARIQAAVMAHGELLSTRVGAAFLQQRGLPVRWVDARECLQAQEVAGVSQAGNFLTASCTFDFDAHLVERFSAWAPAIILTQGFIAYNKNGETVLLGRGGSDTSASYFAAKLHARRCEIWTDVPGMYTANPREVSEARQLRQLDYDEAQEIASMGAKVLHPRCLAPLKHASIPLHVVSTLEPERAGTVISHSALRANPCVKAISTKSNITLLSIENLGMWQQAGFLADLFSCFKQQGISIDLVSTSESNVTVSIDPLANALNPQAMDTLLAELKILGKVTMIYPCAVVSLVGQEIRSILHQLGPALEVFEEQKVYLVAQAASDLNLTFVVEESARNQLVAKLHQLLFENNWNHSQFGEPWQQRKNAATYWWQEKQGELLNLATTTSPLYVYDEATLQSAVTQLQGIKAIDRIFYALKANSNEDILRLFYKRNIGFECVSLGELNKVFSLFPGIDPQRVLFTPNFAPRHEYAYALEKKCFVTLDSVYPLQQWPDLFRGQSLLVRLDPGQGRGHHQHVKTAGEQSKFGIAMGEVPALRELVARLEVHVVGLHAHAGSGITDPRHWAGIATFLLEMTRHFPEARYLNLGGGLAVPTQLHDGALNLAELEESLQKLRREYSQYEFWLEPGRFLVAHAGVLLARVTQLKEKNGISFIGIDAGMNSLLRPALYGAYHPMVNLSRLHDAAEVTAHIVGPICESADTLGYSRRFPATQEDDVVLIANTGAYGRVMASQYNCRNPAEEHFCKGL